MCVRANPILCHTQCRPNGRFKRKWPSGVYRWEFKARHFDSTMLFKMGKFYEMFEMDAHVGVEILGLIYMKVGMPLTCSALISIPHNMQWAPCNCCHPTYVCKLCTAPGGLTQLFTSSSPLFGHAVLCHAIMCKAIIWQSLHADLTGATSRLWVSMLQGEQPHCGFPEKNYHHNAERLARAGLKVVVVEQTETPDQLRIRNEERKANKQNQVAASFFCSICRSFTCSGVNALTAHFSVVAN